jgi:hypothetical protein
LDEIRRFKTPINTADTHTLLAPGISRSPPANHVVSRKPGRSEKAAPYQENARHAAVLVHDIVEKLTADGSLVDRCGLFVVRCFRQQTAFLWSEPGAVATGFFDARCSRFAPGCRLVACGPTILIFEKRQVFKTCKKAAHAC